MPFIECDFEASPHGNASLVGRTRSFDCIGLMPQMVAIMGQAFNQSYTFVQDQGDPFRMLNNGYGDIHISGYTLKEKRWKIVNFGFPFIAKIDYIYSPKPVAQVSESGLFDVFGPSTYVWILISLVLFCLVFLGLVYKDGQTSGFRYSYAVLYVLAAFFQETYPESRLPRGSTFLIIQWYIYSMVLTIMYSSVLITQLTYVKPEGGVNVLEDIVIKGMSPLLFYRASEVDSWAASEVYPYKELGQSINTFKDNTNAIRMLIEGGNALLSTSTVAEFELNEWRKHNPKSTQKDILRSDEPFSNGQYGSWIFGVENPIQEKVSKFLMRCFDNGIYHKVLREYGMTTATNTRMALPQQLGLKHFKVLSIVLLAGLLLSLVLFILEHILTPAKLKLFSSS